MHTHKDVFLHFKHKNGAYRARTYDPLLVRQMLSQLSYDPIKYLFELITIKIL